MRKILQCFVGCLLSRPRATATSALAWIALAALPAARAAGSEATTDPDAKFARGSPAITLDIPIRAAAFGTKFYEETARQFEAQRPGVRVNLYGDPRIEDKIRVRIIDGDFPDAAFAPYMLWPALIRAGRVRELGPLLDGLNWENDGRWRDSFLPGALGSWEFDGGTYGVPLGYACWSLFYNRGLFRAQGWTEPRTWDEFFALCERIPAAGVAPVAMTGIYGNYPDAFQRAAFYNLAGRDGWRALNSLAPGARTDPRFVRAAGVLQRIAQQHTIRGWEGMTHTAAQLAFFEGRAAMTVSGSWMVHEMEGKIPADFDLAVMPFPVFADGVTDPTTIQTGADCFFLFATGDATRERLAADFLRFLTSRARAEAFVRELHSPVAVRGVPLEAYSPRLRETIAAIERAREAFNMPQVMLQPPTVRQALIDQRKLLMAGRITPEEFGARLESAAANDRARAADPTRVEVRHPWAGGLLGAALAATLGGLGWGAWRKRRAARIARAARAGGGTESGGRRGELTADGDVPLGKLRRAQALGFVGPAFFLYAALVLLPGLAAFAWAFLRWDGIGRAEFAGTFNFRWLLLESDGFWVALRNNAFLMFVPAAVVVPVALACAAAIHRGVWGGKFFRVVFLFPNLLGGIAATLLWLNAYEPHGGLINAALVALGRVTNSAWLQGFDGFPWLATANLYTALVPIYLWMACGFNLVLYLAAMESVPTELYEAAELDGASKLRQFFTITLPMIWEVLVISAVFLVISGLNAFELIWLLTAQDPDSASHTLGTLMVTSMFKEFAIGRATAIAVVLFALVLAGTALVRRGLRREAVEL